MNHRQQQERNLQQQLKGQALDLDNAQRLARWGELCANPYVSVRVQILQLRNSNAPRQQIEQLTQNAAVLEQNRFNLEAWREFQQLGGI